MTEALNSIYEIEQTLETMLRLNIVETAAITIMGVSIFIGVLAYLIRGDK